MIAVLWLFLAIALGWQLFRLLFGQPGTWLKKNSFQAGRAGRSPVFSLLFRLAASIWLGLLPLAWLTYITALLASRFLPLSVHPLALVNPLLLAAGYGVVLVWLYLRYFRSRLLPISAAGRVWPAVMRSLAHPGNRYYLVTAAFFTVFATWLMTLTFNQSGTFLQAGYSVFSDFAPHTALISSFSHGRNFPTQYPHFAHDGIAYHFIFYFLSGNLHFMGFPMSWAINLPSILGMISFCLLLGTLAVQLTGQRAAYALVPLLVFLRSSLAFWTHLRGLLFLYGTGAGAIPQIIRSLLAQDRFIGQTPRDDWGLWGINVYANQRHFLPGLSLALIMIMAFLPDMLQHLKEWPGWKSSLLSRSNWLIVKAADRHRYGAAWLICCLLPYFHGSATVALLLILAVMAVWSHNRLAYALTGLITVAATMFQGSIFSSAAGVKIRPVIQTGFIVADKSLPGITSYLVEMSGLILPLWLITFILAGKRQKKLLAAFMLPLVFAFFVSLTPDVTVNHKYIMFSLMLANIPVADLLIRLWQKGRQHSISRPIWGARLIAAVLALMLMITGIQELIIVRNLNQNVLSIDEADPVASWIRRYTRPDAVFVTAPYHYHAFFLSGRLAWYGHSYYAWSAGHDTAGRHNQMRWLLAGGDGDAVAVKAMIRGERLDYLIIDDTLRRHVDFELDEAFFREHFEQVVDWPNQDNTVIYALR